MAGRVIAITGAFGVLGSAVAKAAAEQGYKVILIDYAATPPAGLLAACGPRPRSAAGSICLSPARRPPPSTMRPKPSTGWTYW